MTCYFTIKGTEHPLSGTYKNITQVMMTIDQHLCAPLNKENLSFKQTDPNDKANKYKRNS